MCFFNSYCPLNPSNSSSSFVIRTPLSLKGFSRLNFSSIYVAFIQLASHAVINDQLALLNPQLYSNFNPLSSAPESMQLSLSCSVPGPRTSKLCPALLKLSPSSPVPGPRTSKLCPALLKLSSIVHLSSYSLAVLISCQDFPLAPSSFLAVLPTFSHTRLFQQLFTPPNAPPLDNNFGFYEALVLSLRSGHSLQP